MADDNVAFSFSGDRATLKTAIIVDASDNTNVSIHFPPSLDDVAFDFPSSPNLLEDLGDNLGFALLPPLGFHATSILLAGKENNNLHNLNFGDIFQRVPPTLLQVLSLVEEGGDVPSYEELWASLNSLWHQGCLASNTSIWVKAHFQHDRSLSELL